MKKFAFLSKEAILHVVEERKTAEEYAKFNGIIVETELPAEHGSPLGMVGGRMEEIIVYDEKTMKVDAKGRELDIIPELAILYKECKGIPPMSDGVTKYAYLDQGAILHVVAERETAEAFAKFNGKVVETTLPAAHGYPLGPVGSKMEELIVYDEKTMKVDAKGRKVDVVPEFALLYRACK